VNRDALERGDVFGGLDQRLKRALDELGYREPTPIQQRAMPAVFGGHDLIGTAQTGTGKTAAFLLPILQHLLTVRRPRHIGHPRALVLSPTRELAVQTGENLRRYVKYADLPYACLIGGVSQYPQVKDIKRGAEVYVACPGRLIDLMTQGIVYLDQVETVVLDEADRMLDMGFLPDIRRLISKLPLARQSLLFSATMPAEVRKLANEFVRSPVEVAVSPETPAVERIAQEVRFVAKRDKDDFLRQLLEQHPEWDKVIVFSKMRHGADRVVRKLQRAGVEAAAIHSDKTQNQRMRALEGFKTGKVRVLVATDIASRGIDVPQVKAVVNMELPMEPESYVHRIGRTARAGESGLAVSFVTLDELPLLKAIERLLRKSVPVSRLYSQAALEKAEREAAMLSAGDRGLPAAAEEGKRKEPRRHHQGGKRDRISFLGRRQPDFGQKGKGSF